MVEGVVLSLLTAEMGNLRVGEAGLREGLRAGSGRDEAGSCHGVAGLADGAEEFVAGAFGQPWRRRGGWLRRRVGRAPGRVTPGRRNVSAPDRALNRS